MRTTRKSLLSLLLVLAMTVGCLGALSLGGVSAAEVAENKTAPAITPKGEYDVWDGTTVSESLTQDENGDYLIQSAADFRYFYNTAASAATAEDVFRLTCDIDMSAANTQNGITFAGTLNGDGHAIKGIKAYSGDTGTRGVKFIATLTGVIENLNFIDFNMTATLDALPLFGTVTGANAAIRNCRFDGKCSFGATSSALAGTVSSDATIENVVLSGTIIRKAGASVAPFANYASTGATFRNCANYMTVVGNTVGEDDEYLPNNGSVSGFIYQADGGNNGAAGPKLYNCVNYADITVTYGEYIAGFIAREYRITSLTMEGCVNYGNITATAATASNTKYVGGFLGRLYDTNKNFGATLSGLVNYGNVNTPGANEVGGLVGTYNHKTVVTATNCANYGDVTGGTRAGGFVGAASGTQYAQGNIIFKNSANYGDVEATAGVAAGYIAYLGVAYANTPAIEGVLLLGNVTGTTGASHVIGQTATSVTNGTDYKARVLSINLTNCVIKGNVTVAEGGLAAMLVALSNQTVEDAYNSKCTNTYISTNAPYTHYNASGVGVTEDLTGTELPANALTDGTVLSTLNAYANTNSYTPWEMGETAPELLPAVLKLSAANLTLRGELVMNMKMDSSALKNLDPSLINGVFVKTESGSWEGNLMTFDNDEPYYYVAVDGLTAETFSLLDTYYVVVIYNGVEYTAHEGTVYSPVKYAERMYADADAETKTVLESIIRYAYYAELNADGESNLLADFNAAVGSNLTEADLDALYNTDLVRGDVDASAMSGIATVGSFLGENLNLVFILDESVTGLTMQVAGETFTYTPEAGHIIIDDLHAGMVRAKLTLTFQTEGGEVTATYAISNYLNTVAENGETVAQQNLAKAAMLYMAAARDYAL